MKNQCRFSISRVFPAIAHNEKGFVQGGDFEFRLPSQLLKLNRITNDE